MNKKEFNVSDIVSPSLKQVINVIDLVQNDIKSLLVQNFFSLVQKWVSPVENSISLVEKNISLVENGVPLVEKSLFSLVENDISLVEIGISLASTFRDTNQHSFK